MDTVPRPPAVTSRRRFFLVAGALAAGCRGGSSSGDGEGRGRRGMREPGGGSTGGGPAGKRRARPDTFVIEGARVFTGVPGRPLAEAVYVRDGRIAAVGRRSDVLAEAGDAPRHEFDGGLVVPGLADAHAHVLGLGAALSQVDLRGAASVDEVVARLRSQAPPSGWIEGRGWDQNLWPGAKMPTHDPLTAAFPDRPVYLRRVDGHAAWGNRALLEAAGVGPDTRAPPGGEILRDGAGRPTGVLVDAAMDLVTPPKPDEAEVARRVERAVAHLAEVGLTSVHDMGGDRTTLAVLRRLAADGRLPVRVEAYAEATLLEDLLSGKLPADPPEPGARVRLVGAKLYADGALGSRGAYLLAPYADRPGHRGLPQMPQARLARAARRAMERGVQLAVHAIGDAANRRVLSAYEAALHATRRKDHRFRIEHAQVVHPQDVPRFALARVVASMQPIHATSDMAWAPDRLGPGRIGRAYAIGRLIRAGAHVCFGSDAPVEPARPTLGLYAAVTRTNLAGEPTGGFLPDQKIDLAAALRGFTSEAAYAVFREDHLGRIAPGMVADLTCFRRNLFHLDPSAWPKTEVAATFVAGRRIRRP